MTQQEYPHLPFVGIEINRAQLRGGGNSSDQTVKNKENRQQHAEILRKQFEHLNAWWGEQKDQRQSENLPEQDGIPLWVQIDPSIRNADFLRKMGFTIVSEEEDGFILVAANDETFKIYGSKLDDFRDALPKKDGPASIYAIGQSETENERIQRILPEALRLTWQTIADDQNVIVDLSISCDVKQPSSDFKPKEDDETSQHFQKREERREIRISELIQEIDEIKRERETQIEKFVAVYNGEILDYYDNAENVDFPDSFTVRISINGKGFKDIVRSFPYLFQVEDLEEIVVDEFGLQSDEYSTDVTIFEPDVNAPSVCIIDSGIQEGHLLLKYGINPSHSRNFIPKDSDTDTADYVSPVGHGTQVAGNVLFPDTIPAHGKYELHGFVQNARILDKNNQLPESVQPAQYIEKIISHYNDEYGTKVFNHSINGTVPYRKPHMSTWAATIDKISYNRDVLVIQSAGNIAANNSDPLHYGVQNHLQAGHDYPDYLHEPSCQLSNPAHSFQALTVGSIGYTAFNNGYQSAIAGEDQTSAFSRSGPGIWDTVKPEVVEIGGDLVKSDTNPVLVSQHSDVTPVLVQSTIHSQSAAGQKSVGTSFAAPRVSGLALQLQAVLPDESALLYRALIANSARWTEWTENNNDLLSVLRQIGYGCPDHERALGNNLHRVTLIISNENLLAREAKLFRVPVPADLRAAESNYDIRIDVTLSYAAMPRRTRKGHYNYLSCRLDWKCSRINESEESFRQSLFKNEIAESDHDGSFPWMLRNDQHGKIPDARCNHGTLQKDWAIVQSPDLPDDFFIGVVGHPGWDNANLYPAHFALVVSFEAINNDIEIYENVRVLVEQLRVQEQTSVAITVDEFPVAF